MIKCYLHTKYAHILSTILDELDIGITKFKDDADFCIIDAGNGFYSAADSTKPKKFIILSTSEVYSCLDLNNKVREVPFTEDSPLVIPSTLSCENQNQRIFHENHSRMSFPNHIVLRICNLYGDDVDSLPLQMMQNFREKHEFIIEHSLYCKKSLLYVEDFNVVMKKVISLFLEGLRGVYNIGGTDVITVGNLADTVYQVLHQTSSKPKLTLCDLPNKFVNFYEVVDISRVQALTNWAPEYSIRKGIWTYIQKELWKKQ